MRGACGCAVLISNGRQLAGRGVRGRAPGGLAERVAGAVQLTAALQRSFGESWVG